MRVPGGAVYSVTLTGVCGVPAIMETLNVAPVQLEFGTTHAKQFW
jgi:hypothetical protein